MILRKKNNGKYETGNLTIENLKTYYTVNGEGEPVEHTLEITDNIAWSSNKPAIATVEGDDLGATIFAAGTALGVAKINAKASSGKQANISVTVKATLSSLAIEGAPNDLYSGQSVQLTALRNDNPTYPNKDAVKWSIAKVEYEKNGQTKTKNNPNASINSKGVLAIKSKLDPDYLTVTVLLETKATKKVDGEKVPLVKAEAVEIPLTQSSVDNIQVRDDEANEIIATMKYDFGKKKGVVNKGISKQKNATNISVPLTQSYTITADPVGESATVETLDVKSSKPTVAKVGYDKNGEAKITAVAKGSAKVTVSGVCEGKAVSTTFNVAVTQPTTSLTIDKPMVVLKNTGKDLKPSFKVKQNKGAVEKIKWSIVLTKGDGEKSEATIDEAKGKVTIKKGKYFAGDEFTVTATSDKSGVEAKATIKIVTASTGVTIWDGVESEKTYSYFAVKKDGMKGKEVKNATVLETATP